MRENNSLPVQIGQRDFCLRFFFKLPRFFCLRFSWTCHVSFVWEVKTVSMCGHVEHKTFLFLALMCWRLYFVIIYHKLSNNYNFFHRFHWQTLISSIKITFKKCKWTIISFLYWLLYTERGSERWKSEHRRVRTSKVFLGWSERQKIRTSKIRTSKRTLKRTSKV